MAGNSKAWTPEKRKRQADIMRERKAWKHSTGPKTNEGKAASAANAHKHGMRSAVVAELVRCLAIQAKSVDKFLKEIQDS